MDNSYIIAMFIALLIGVQINRFLPLFLPQKFLTHPILQKLNQILPLVIMVLLVLTSLSFPHTGGSYLKLSAQVIALVIVILSYRWLKNVLISIALGILSLNSILFLFH